MKMKHYYIGGRLLRRFYWNNIWLLFFVLGCAETAVPPTAPPPAPTAAVAPTAMPTATALPTHTPESLMLCDGGLERPFTILALGDSYTIGESVTETERFPNQLATALQNSGVNVPPPKIIARTGWTTRDLFTAINNETLTPPYDLVTLLIGVNNQFRGQDITLYEQEFQELLQFAISQSALGIDSVIVISIPDWGATPFALRRNPEQIGIEIDAHNLIAQTQAEQAGIPFINITEISRQVPTAPSLVADDFLHPSGEQYRQWVEELLPTVCAFQPQDN